MPLLTAKGLKKRYAGKQALDGIDFSVESGRIIGLLGPNGSGKTTLLKVLAGLLQPDAGEIEYPGGGKHGIASKQVVSFSPDRMEFPAWMRVKDAFELWQAQFPDYSQERADRMIALLELDKKAVIKKLSKGMQERVTLALTFSREAKIYLLDEPLGGIDPLGKAKVLESIISAQPDGSSILLSTHLVKDVETVFDSFFLIANGRIIFAGDCEQIRAESGRTAEQVYLEVFSNVGTV